MWRKFQNRSSIELDENFDIWKIRNRSVLQLQAATPEMQLRKKSLNKLSVSNEQSKSFNFHGLK